MRKCANKTKNNNASQTNKKTNKKHNERSHQTLVVIVGGYDKSNNKLSNEIYYCVSNDINNKNNNQSIWQLSVIKLPLVLCDCQCIITNKESRNPKLIVLGGESAIRMKTDIYLEYNLCDVIGYDTFNRFIIDIKQV